MLTKTKKACQKKSDCQEGEGNNGVIIFADEGEEWIADRTFPYMM